MPTPRYAYLYHTFSDLSTHNVQWRRTVVSIHMPGSSRHPLLSREGRALARFILRDLVGGAGLEPTLTESKSAVLPLDEPPKIGDLGGIRTHDLLLRRQTLYPAELRGLNWDGLSPPQAAVRIVFTRTPIQHGHIRTSSKLLHDVRCSSSNAWCAL